MCNIWRTLSMAYFLKKTKRNDRLYLSIYESFYSPETKNTRHKSFRKIGFVDALIEQGIDDPISHFQKEVNELNSKRETEKCRINFQQISDVSPELCLGYVPIAKILNMLDVKEHFGYLSSSRKFEFDVYDVFSVLILIVQTITLKSIRNLLFKKEVLPKKIERTLLWEWAFF